MQCSVYIATSLDGYIARADGGLDWLDRVQRPGEDYGYAAFAATVDTMVRSRRATAKKRTQDRSRTSSRHCVRAGRSACTSMAAVSYSSSSRRAFSTT